MCFSSISNHVMSCGLFVCLYFLCQSICLLFGNAGNPIVGAARLRDKSGADATTQRREHKSQRRSVRRDKGRREDAKTRTQVATSQRQTRQGQTRRREDTNTSCNVAASDATTRRRRPNSQRRSVAASDATKADATTRRHEHKPQRRSVRRDYAKTPPKLATSQRQTRQREDKCRNSQLRSVAASDETSCHPTSLREMNNFTPFWREAHFQV